MGAAHRRCEKQLGNESGVRRFEGVGVVRAPAAAEAEEVHDRRWDALKLEGRIRLGVARKRLESVH